MTTFEQTLNKIVVEAEALTHSVIAEINRQSNATDAVLFHYTNDSGLFGILTSGTLHFGDVFKMNDPSELRHGAESFMWKLRSRNADFAGLMSEISNPEKIAFFFCCSFSKSLDDLSQWRAYGDNGRGYVIHFNRQTLHKLRFSDAPNDEIDGFAVGYDSEMLENTLNNLADLFIQVLIAYKPSANKIEWEKSQETLIKLTMLLYRIISLFKHPAYECEGEYRLLSSHSRHIPPKLKQKQRGKEMVDYRELDWRGQVPNLIEGITIGPAADETKAREFIHKCLEIGKLTLPDEKIVISDIPYRA